MYQFQQPALLQDPVTGVVGYKNPVTGQEVPFDFLGAFAWASLPAAASYAGYRARVTDGGPTGGVYVVSNGVRWKPVNGSANLATLAAAVSGITNVEQLPLQALLPVGMWQLNDTLRIWASVGKNGTTDAGNLNLRIGTAGTASDAAITGLSAFQILAAASQSGGYFFDVKLTGNTAAQKQGANATSLASSYGGGASGNATAAATTIPDASANALYVSVGLVSAGTTNTLSMSSGSIQLITP